ncbi:WAT1-related protein At3g53210 [Selaginella moellendorffii]|uniref:WAT1-related protein At3g53210 n=1 Tax=Selaginella moellendorffii TaxID=88036 RepID=UPI000D1CB2F5|nr:WAT1-related protein At3g53210 [Selaginella moellendorffii]|eukprot:XP_024527984.1 WAT1-related protein At3g53210 [Selaginella moellendorffii]
MGEERIDGAEGGKRDADSGRRNFRLHFALIAVQAAFSGFEILSRLALDRGAGKFSFSFYRNCVAFVVLAIASLLLERKKLVPLTLAAGLKVFMLGLIGVTINQLLYLTGLSYTSAVFASALRNCIPVFTFLLALVSRKEKLNLRTRHGQAKLLGCSLGVCGSVLLSVYRGPVLIRSSLSLFHVDGSQHFRAIDVTKKQYIQFLKFIRVEMASWTLGAVCLIGSCLSFSSFLILQVSVLAKNPAPITFASFCCLSSLVQFPLLALVFEPEHWSSWKRISSSEALSIGYAGAIASGFVSAVQSWGVHRGGPVVVAAYQPLETVITAFLGLIFLRESLHLGSLIGALVVVTGLYLLIWGQEKEHQLVASDQSNLPFSITRTFDMHSSSSKVFPDNAPFSITRSFDASNNSSRKVFPEPPLTTLSRQDQPALAEITPAVTVADILENSNKWRVYTVNNAFQEAEEENVSHRERPFSQGR